MASNWITTSGLLDMVDSCLDFMNDHKKPILLAGTATFGVYKIANLVQRYRHRSRMRAAILKRRRDRESQFQEYQRRLNTGDHDVIEERNRLTQLSMKQLSELLTNESVTAVQVLESYQWKALQAQERTNCICLFIDEAMIEAEALDHTYIYSVSELLTNESVTAVQVLESYQWKALQAQERTNCICLFIDEAIIEAEALDQNYKGKSKPPLFGIPVCIKENILVKGHDSTRGYAQDLLNPNVVAPEDGLYVRWLKSMGAVPFVRSNVPQTLLTYSCSNPIYGTTNHPMSRTRTPGGSSGGDGAMVACGAALLAIGSDMGGSIRVPAHFCGVAGLRPTSLRSTMLGSIGSVSPTPWIHMVRGPQARDTETLAEFYKIYYAEPLFKLDRLVAPMPFDLAAYESTRPLKVGYYTGDPYFMPVAGCRRAVMEAKKALEVRGHDLVPIPALSMLEAAKIIVAAAMLDEGRGLQKALANDIVEQHPTTDLDRSASGGRLFKRFLRLLDAFGLIPKGSRYLVDLNQALSTTELNGVYSKAFQMQRGTIDDWSKVKLDAVLCPAFGTCAVPHDVPSHLMFAAAYASIFNILDFPAGVVGVTAVNKNDLVQDDQEFDKNSSEGRLVYEATRDTLGLPVGVQVVSYPYRDEVCLRVMREIEQGLLSPAI